MKAVGYTRVTAAEAKRGYMSCAAQEEKIREFATKQGLEVVAVYSDDPIGILQSAPTLGDVCSRAGIVTLLDESLIKEWAFVITADEDRLLRTDMALDGRAELIKHGKSVVKVGDKIQKRKAPSRRKEVKVAEDTSEMTVAERLLRGREAGARAGKHQSGPAPYGYMRDYSERNAKGVRLQIHPEEAAVVRTIFKEYLRRRSMKKLIEFLDSNGLRTRRKKQWSRAGVSWILKNETYLGRVHFGNIRAKGQHPAIISPIIFNKVQKLIRKNNKRSGKNAEGKNTTDKKKDNKSSAA